MGGLGLLPRGLLFLGLKRAENRLASVVVGSSSSSSSDVSSTSSSAVDESSLASGDVSISSSGAGVVVGGSSGSLPGRGLKNPGRAGRFLVMRLGRGLLVVREVVRGVAEVPDAGALVVDDAAAPLDRLDWNLPLVAPPLNLDRLVVVEDAVVASTALEVLLSSLASVVREEEPLKPPGRERNLLLLPPWKDRRVEGTEVVVVVDVVEELLEASPLEGDRFLVELKEGLLVN